MTTTREARETTYKNVNIGDNLTFDGEYKKEVKNITTAKSGRIKIWFSNPDGSKFYYGPCAPNTLICS